MALVMPRPAGGGFTLGGGGTQKWSAMVLSASSVSATYKSISKLRTCNLCERMSRRTS